MARQGQAYRRYLQSIPTPAAGAELDIVPFGQGPWRIQALIFTLVTSAAAGVRAVQLDATDGTTEWWRSPVTAEIDPSTTQVFTAHPGIVGGGSAGPEVAKQASAVFAATASGVAALANGDTLTGFTVNLQAVGAAASMDVVVTNVQGGAITYRITAPVTGTVVTVNLPDPLPALNGGVAPTVTATGGAGTPAGSVVAYGRGASLDAVISQPFPDEGLWLEQGWHLRTLTANRDAADQYSAVAIIVEEIPSGPSWHGQASQPFTVEPVDG